MTDSRKVVAIVQARLGSSRFPGKVMQLLAGSPVLVWCVERARRAAGLDAVVVATTDEPSDDPIAHECEARGYRVYRGAHLDVLDRFYKAACAYEADTIVRLTADCPLIDPGLIDETVQAFFETGADFAANRLPPPWKRTYPIGLDVEVVSFAALEQAWEHAQEKFEREHVLPYLYDVEGRFKVHILQHEPDYGALRWTLDNPLDLEMLRLLVARLGNRMDFSWREALAVYLADPNLAAINAAVGHKSARDVDARMQ